MKQKLCHRANYGQKRPKTQFIVIHYTANLGDCAQNNAEYFAREQVGSSAHFFVDENEIWSSVPQEAIAWHCGAKKYHHPTCRNANSIGVEICMQDKQGNLRLASIQKAASLVADLCQQYKLSTKDILRHYDVTGKLCPQPMVQNNQLWNEFLKMIEHKKLEELEMRYQYYEQMPTWAQPTISKLVRKGYLKGEGNGILNLSEDILKVFVVNDRAGLYGT